MGHTCIHMHTDICIPYSPQVLPGHEVNNIVIQTYVPTLPHKSQCSQTQPYLSPTWHLPLKWTLKILDISPPLFLDLNRQINTSNHRSVIQLVGNYQNVENILLFYLFDICKNDILTEYWSHMKISRPCLCFLIPNKHSKEKKIFNYQDQSVIHVHVVHVLKSPVNGSSNSILQHRVGLKICIKICLLG